MDKKKKEKNFEDELQTADNLAEDATKEQNIKEKEAESGEEDSENTDNVSEELAKLNDSYLRLMAEYDNYRKRTIKEKAELIKTGSEKALVGLLPVIDDFERAIKTVETATDLSAVKEGILLIYSKFMNYLQQNGVKAIESLGQIFDPEMNEAVATIPATDEEQKGKIIDSIQTGYTLYDKVIRHAKVVVAN
ncbi:MAG: nucleotide exchange factor GrpE [Candidatus Azobacteroides sp.]|nr:nucleotide exchange factor GrpE [Candidatus Azobacteroides sp.]